MLASKQVGVDSCWINFFNPETAKEMLGLPDNVEVVMLLDLGYADTTSKPTENHFSRKDFSKTVKYL